MKAKEINELIEQEGFDMAIDWLLMANYIEPALLVVSMKNQSEFKLYKEQLT